MKKYEKNTQYSYLVTKDQNLDFEGQKLVFGLGINSKLVN